MSDDLVRRLRQDAPFQHPSLSWADAKEAADRIEELEALAAKYRESLEEIACFELSDVAGIARAVLKDAP